MKFRPIALFIVAMLITLGASAQSAKVKRAKQYMKDIAYRPAIVLLNQILEKEDNPDAKIMIAECYRKVNDWENAEFWYAQVVRQTNVEPIHKLYYGESLQRNGKCDLAKEWYTQFATDSPSDSRGQYLSKACDYENELLTKSAPLYQVKHMDFNSSYDDFSPALFGDQVIFASERDQGSAVKREHTWTGFAFNELYAVDAKSTGTPTAPEFMYGKPAKFSKKLNSKYHEAAVTFSPDKGTIYFTRNNYNRGKTGTDDEGHILLKIYEAKGSKGSWSEVTELPMNSDEYNTAHPTLSSDGNKLYFASDMPGGFGGMDIYVSEKQGSSWGPPVNMGPKVNTEGHEVFPHIYKTNRLYFASDGQIGLGGYDIYYADIAEGGELSDPTNVGFPINTKSDDFGITMNDKGDFGYFTSDRSGGNGRDDIYSFFKQAAPVEVYVFDKNTKEPIQGAIIKDECTGNTLKTGKDGRARYEMKLDITCNLAASYEGYLPNSAEASSKNLDENNPKVLVEIPLSKPYKYSIEGVVFDQQTGLPLEGAVVMLTNDCDKATPDSIKTDALGKYKFNLDRDCCYAVKAARPNYFAQTLDKFADTDRKLCTKEIPKDSTLRGDIYLQPTGFVSTPNNPTNPNNPINSGNPGNPVIGQPGKGTVVSTPTNPDAPIYLRDKGVYVKPGSNDPYTGEFGGVTYEKGRPTKAKPGQFVPSPTPPGVDGSISYLLHIYYDFDQSYIRKEADSELYKLLKLMQDNPTYIIELGSHTDSRGSDTYNNRLSQRRAEAAVRWLVNKGIERDRMVPRGYGESVNVNSCANNIPCSESEHQFNRRTEFKVLGCKGCVENSTLSAPNPMPKVDKCHGCPF